MSHSSNNTQLPVAPHAAEAAEKSSIFVPNVGLIIGTRRFIIPFDRFINRLINHQVGGEALNVIDPSDAV